MKIAFFSNFLNHHQLPLCEALYNIKNVEFIFVACEETHQERLNMGYDDMNTKYPFVIRAYENSAMAEKIAMESDVVIFGSLVRQFWAV